MGIGWDISLLGLARHRSDPATARLDEAAWAATEGGGRLMTGSGDASCAVSVADGADDAAARAAADRTIAFYTGAPA